MLIPNNLSPHLINLNAKKHTFLSITIHWVDCNEMAMASRLKGIETCRTGIERI